MTRLNVGHAPPDPTSLFWVATPIKKLVFRLFLLFPAETGFFVGKCVRVYVPAESCFFVYFCCFGKAIRTPWGRRRSSVGPAYHIVVRWIIGNPPAGSGRSRLRGSPTGVLSCRGNTWLAAHCPGAPADSAASAHPGPGVGVGPLSRL